MMDLLPLTIVIPSYNRASKIKALLESICLQRLEGDEIIVCDDGSTDDTCAESRKVPGVQVIAHEKNQGMVANWNACLKAGTRDWICLIHDDDSLESGGLAALRRACVLAQEPSLITHQYASNPPDDGFRCRISAPGTWAVLHCPTIPSGAVVHRSIVTAVGGFNPAFGYSADLEYFARIAAKFPLLIIESPHIINYRLHGANHQFHTWRQVDFFTQFESLQRAILAHAKVTEAGQEQQILEDRLMANFLYMLKISDQLGDSSLVRSIARELQRFGPRLSPKQRAKIYVAANTGWLPKWKSVQRLN